MDQKRSFAARTWVTFGALTLALALAAPGANAPAARAQSTPQNTSQSTPPAAGAQALPQPSTPMGAGAQVDSAKSANTAAGAAGAPAPSQDVQAVADEAAASGSRVLEFRYTPAHYAQIAIWVENENGEYLRTVALTEATSRRGIGNRPGASQMNSGFRWPYGRREGVLPIWGHRRAEAEGAKPFKRVIFQNRKFEGLASRTSDDFSRDDYFCLSFNNSKSKKDALDAVSCASVFSSDKGRYITDADVSNGYAEPYEDVESHQGRMQPLTIDSVYPPRRDVKPCTSESGCFDHADVARYNDDALAVMPELDAVTMATPPGGTEEKRLFAVPSDWADGKYRACIEVNIEGDHNATFDESHFPTPMTPTMSWDSWALSFGYPYRGQPSVVYCTPFELEGSGSEMKFSAATADGAVGGWDTAAPSYGEELADMHGMTDDHAAAPGSGADRLFMNADGARFTVVSKPSMTCTSNAAPTAVANMRLERFPTPLHAHEYAELEFDAASDDTSVFRYEVRVSTEPMPDADSFMKGAPAKSASVAAEALMVPVDAKPGQAIKVAIGGLTQETHYFVGVRAVDGCAASGPVSVAEITTPTREFATVTPCFVATAAYGTPLAAEIGVLRRFRDRHLINNVVGRSFVDAYYKVGPKLASIIREREDLRAASRALLTPVVALVRLLDD